MKVLVIIVSRKGVIPYDRIVSIDSLNSKPENSIFFEFYSTLKGKAADEEEYNNSKLLYTLLKMQDMSDLNNLYNAQDVILLCEIFENRFQAMFEKSGFNPRKCDSASKLSDCTQGEQSKVILAIPKNNLIMETFEKTLTSSFSCVNILLSFDIEFLMPNLQKIKEKMNIEERRIITKILKLDENNQYGYAMTKHMSTGCIKEHTSSSWLESNILLKTVDFR